MNKILTVLGFSANDGTLAEHLLDFIFLVNKRVQQDAVLLVAAADVHEEMKAKVRLAAEVAFRSVEIITAPQVVSLDKNVQVNRLFKAGAEQVAKSYRVPWLWLEPDAVPLQHGWLEEIAESYYDQPRRYCGSWLMGVKEPFLARIAVYPPDAITDLAPFLNGTPPFSVAAAAVIVPRSTKTRLVNEVAIFDESTKFNESAMVVHSDKQAILMNKLRPEFEAAAAKKKK